MSLELGRPVEDLVTVYTQEAKKLAHAQPCSKQVSDVVYISAFSQLSLAEYIQAGQKYCSYTHSQPCSECTRMLEVAVTILLYAW